MLKQKREIPSDKGYPLYWGICSFRASSQSPGSIHPAFPEDLPIRGLFLSLSGLILSVGRLPLSLQGLFIAV